MRIDDKRIAERCRRPRCKGFEGAYDGAATGENPFCGDALEVRVALERRACGLAVARASFEGYACSLCTASADVLMERASGMPAEDAAVLTVDDVLRWWGGLEVGRTRKGCVDLPVSCSGARSRSRSNERGRVCYNRLPGDARRRRRAAGQRGRTWA